MNKVFIDFDGVIYDTVKEAYAIACLTFERITELSEVRFDTEHYSEFYQQRYLISPAWNYHYLWGWLKSDRAFSFETVLPRTPNDEARLFMSKFFKVRETQRKCNWDEWLKLNTLYSGAEKFIGMMNDYPSIFDVVTVKDRDTVIDLLERGGLKNSICIYSNDDFEHYGSKSKCIEAIMRDQKVKKAIFIDDTSKHLDDCSRLENLELSQALWGYVRPEERQNNIDSVIKKLRGYLPAVN